MIPVNQLRFRILFLLGLFHLAVAICSAQKLTPEEVVAKHLESIGTAEARTAITSRVAQGSSDVTIRIGGHGHAVGGAVMASQGRMSLIGVIFGPQDYANEKAAFDGTKLTLGELTPGNRTRLGIFFRDHDFMFKEGLIGGTLSAAWPLLDLSVKNPKLKYAGIKKVNDRSLYVLEYEPRSGGNLDIRLYFDSETFQHVRTEYERSFTAPTVTRPDKAARQKENRLKFIEEFSNFKVEHGLSLPHTYKMQLTIDSEGDPLLQDWVITLSQFVFNKNLDAKQFDVNAK
ncbi:MAG TPA: hypothetical protein VLB68_32075 [Pyrinomonadaceae bacterium]|nr:hypothetical protein [Pyrinomonadaceae bacterium]